MRRPRSPRRPLRLLWLAVLVAFVAGWLAVTYRTQQLELSGSPIRVRIERGAGVAAIGRAVREAGVELAPWRFWLSARARGDARAIKAGVYELTAPITLKALLDKMVRGDVLLSEITVVEGWTFRQMRAALARHPDLLHDSATLDERALLARLDAPEQHPEGLFFPSTYRFSPGASDFEILRAAYRRMRQELGDAWVGRRAGLPVTTPYEALVLASMVERETGSGPDRVRIAAVFENRLRRGMLLQSDPTTIYGLGDRFDGNLRKRDLLADSPYNTYVRSGLPPTPIALPGRASIDAVVQPANENALYFVARGDGTSEFSADLDAHNRAVARYQMHRAK